MSDLKDSSVVDDKIILKLSQPLSKPLVTGQKFSLRMSDVVTTYEVLDHPSDHVYSIRNIETGKNKILIV